MNRFAEYFRICYDHLTKSALDGCYNTEHMICSMSHGPCDMHSAQFKDEQETWIVKHLPVPSHYRSQYRTGSFSLRTFRSWRNYGLNDFELLAAAAVKLCCVGNRLVIICSLIRSVLILLIPRINLSILSEMTDSSTFKVWRFTIKRELIMIQASWRRWPILILWLLYPTNHAFQFLELTSVMEPIVQFYHVTEDQVLWMSVLVKWSF